MTTHNHLTLDERKTIQSLLDKKSSFKAIARHLDRDCTTISKEVRRNSIEKNTFAFNSFKNRCIKRHDCLKTTLCSLCHTKQCWACRKCNCNSICYDFSEEHCSLLSKAPYVCNGCERQFKCQLRKFIYDANQAHNSYKELLRDSRSGLAISEEELLYLDKFISPLIIHQNQSIHVICENNRDKIMFSKRYIYTLANSGLLTARNIDLPRTVHRKQRKKSKEFKVDKACRLGRSYSDFENYIVLHPDSSIVEMDTVIGSVGGKCILTLYFRNTGLQLGFLRDSNDSASVTKIFESLYYSLGCEVFTSLFQIIVTDNGAEFSNPSEIEKWSCRVFYCDPGKAYQKGGCERNHVEFRKICPKGSSFDSLSQDDVNLAFSHITNYLRKKLNNHSPRDIFSFFYKEDAQRILLLLHVITIDHNDVVLKPSLLQPSKKVGDDHDN